MIERVPNAEHGPDPREIARLLLERYDEKFQLLSDTLSTNRENLKSNEKESLQPRITVVVSLWESGSENLTSKMFRNTLRDLMSQAKSEGLVLDIIIGINNGGGPTLEAGNTTTENIIQSVSAVVKEFQSEGTEIKYQTTSLVHPDITDFSPSDAWTIPNDKSPHLSSPKGNEGSIIVVNQPYHEQNKGKMKMLRDISTFVEEAIIDHGYTTDAVLQIDAESILQFSEASSLKIDKKTINPIKVLFNQLTRKDLVAVGTKDLFKIFDDNAGEITDKPARASQVAYMNANKNNFITLPGGCMMVKPEDYLAGMFSISKTTPNVPVEDYMITQLLLAKYPAERFVSMNILNHINRSPEDQHKAIEQLALWRVYGNMVDKIFPRKEKVFDPLFNQVIGVAVKRLQDIASGDRASATQFLQDIKFMFQNINRTWIATDRGKNDISPLITGEDVLNSPQEEGERKSNLKKLWNVFSARQ